MELRNSLITYLSPLTGLLVIPEAATQVVVVLINIVTQMNEYRHLDLIGVDLSGCITSRGALGNNVRQSKSSFFASAQKHAPIKNQYFCI